MSIFIPKPAQHLTKSKSQIFMLSIYILYKMLEKYKFNSQLRRCDVRR